MRLFRGVAASETGTSTRRMPKLPGPALAGSAGRTGPAGRRGLASAAGAARLIPNFRLGSASPAEVIPASNATYDISGLSSATGSATFTVTPSVGLDANPQAVVTATSVAGNTAASWDPMIHVDVPGGAVGGNYSATIIHSVS